MFSKKFSALLAVSAASAVALVGCGSVESADSTDSSADNAAGSETSNAQEWEAPEGLSGELDYYSCLLYTSPSPRDRG